MNLYYNKAYRYKNAVILATDKDFLWIENDKMEYFNQNIIEYFKNRSPFLLPQEINIKEGNEVFWQVTRNMIYNSSESENFIFEEGVDNSI